MCQCLFLLTSDFMSLCAMDLDMFIKRYQGKKQTFWLALEHPLTTNEKDLSSDWSPPRKMNFGYGKRCLAIETL
ncbi:hypothetical protein PsorP6_011345 [Peronosclerospora sorghi]|uniref:Uncharacterized protein n=1 Tax=Peronosclerospora sorghi TaxID=230839 RepID=A0ACC0WLJ3_9STRA|nr:hypothetical protein PsorP6_011345 [Peronosclerospora sorghi]